MRTFHFGLALVGLAAALPADVIVLMDGEVLRDATIKSFTIKEISFRDDNRRERTLPTWKVATVRPENLPTKYKQGLDSLASGDRDTGVAQLKDFIEKSSPTASYAWLRQFAFWQVAMAYKGEGTTQGMVDAINEIEALLKEIPESKFHADYYRLKLNYYLDQGGKDLENAGKWIDKWLAQVREQSLADHYRLEAMVDQLLLQRDYLKNLPSAKAAVKFKEIVDSAGQEFVLAANRARTEMGWCYLLDRKWDDGLALFEQVLKSPLIDEATQARAFLGRGHGRFLKQTQDKGEARLALLDYMRVAVEFAEDADESPRFAELVSEALYYAEQAYKAWGPANADECAKILRGRRKIRYASTVHGPKN